VATRWIDFTALKREVSIRDVLARYGLFDGLREKKPGKLVGACPIHGGKNGTSFNVDTEKNVFHCFSQCGGGNILDLVMKIEHCSIREAGEKLTDWFGLRFERRRSGATPETAASAAPEKAAASHTSVRTDAPGVNPPLERPLKDLNADHPYLEGRRLEISAPIAEEVRRRVAQVPGAVDVRIQQRQDFPQIKIDVDRVKAAYLGITNEKVVKDVVTALNSSTNFAPTFWFDHSNGNHYFLGAQYHEEAIADLETLKNIPITSSDGRTTLLRNIATFERAIAPAEVNHVNITRVIDVYANVDGRDVGSVATDIEQAISGIELPPGYALQMRGEVASMRESFANMGFGLLLAVALVYLVMVVQFRSFGDPLIILAAVPLGLIGVLWTLWATGTSLNIQSFMGVIMMVGIAVSYSILYVDFANRRLADGLSAREAVVDAGKTRLRPILMTSLAAMLALLPMALTSERATTPLARAVIGGVGASTLLTLFVVPALYVSFKKVAQASRTAEQP